MKCGLTKCSEALSAKSQLVGTKGGLFVLQVSLEHDDAEIEEDEGVHRIVFIMMSSAHAPSGRWPAKQNLQLYAQIGVDTQTPVASLEGVRLEVARHKFVPHHKSLGHPLRDQRMGALRQFSEDEFSKYVLMLVQQDGVSITDVLVPDSVAIAKLKYKDESGDIVVVTGYADDFEPLIVGPDAPDPVLSADGAAAEDVAG